MPPRKRAVLCVAINQLAFPGLGTVLMGRRVGWAQAGMMVAGFLLVTGFVLWYVVCAIRYAAHPNWDEMDFKAAYQPFKWALLSGLTASGVAWVWSLFSSIKIWRERLHHPPELPTHRG